MEKDNLKPVYLFCGEDSFSAYEKAMLWKNKFIEKYGDLNTLIYRGDELNAHLFQSAIESFPFLSEKKLIFIYDFLKEGDLEEQKKVAELLDQVGDYLVVIFLEHNKPDARTSLYKKLVKVGNVELFDLKIGAQLDQWIKERFKRKCVAVGNEEITLLGELVGNNLWNLNNEINKICLFAKGQRIDREMILDVVSVNPSSSVFKLIDLLSEKKAKEAIMTLETLVASGEESVAIFYMLVRHFRIMSEVKDLKERDYKAGEIAKIIKEHPFVVNKIFGQVKNFNSEKLQKIYSELLNIDTGFKTGRIKISTNDDLELVRELEIFMTKVCLE